MSTSEMKKLETRIDEIKHALFDLEPMRPGSITCQYRDPKERKTPFWQLSYTHKMRGRTEYVRPENLEALRREVENFRIFNKLMDEWVALSLRLSQLRIKETRTPEKRAKVKPKKKIV